MKFEKWEALGNDFVIVDAEGCDASLSTPGRDNPMARMLCDRRRGIGADGVLVVDRNDEAPPRMHVWNSDGSRAAMCGNGVRCVAAHWTARHDPRARDVIVMTDAGPRPCHVHGFEQDHYDVSVQMGRAELLDEVRIEERGRIVRFRRASMGNPHLVALGSFPSGELDHLGPAMERSVEGGTNVELVELGTPGRALRVEVWERGAGRTLACGTGACAAAAVAVAEGHRPAGVPVLVELPGGSLVVTVQAGSAEVELRGAARRVYVGQLPG